MSDAIPLNPEEAALLKREALDSVGGAFAYSGGERLDKPGLRHRERLRLGLTGGTGREVQWYLKRYGPPLEETGAQRCCGGAHDAGHVSPAEAELTNIGLLKAAGVPTMRPVAFGSQKDMWGTVRSYLIVEAVPGDALERCFGEYFARHRDDAAAMAAFNAALVDLVAKLHGAGLAHRDLYASHVFLHEAPGGAELYLIDLARVFAPRWRRFRWRAKDLAQLRYSMPADWADIYWSDFLDQYLARLGGGRRRLAGAVNRKVAAMRRRSRGRRTHRGGAAEIAT